MKDKQKTDRPSGDSRGSDRKAVLLGSTGLVGGALIRRLKDSPVHAEVRALTRRSLGSVADHPKVREIMVDFSAIRDRGDLFSVHDVFCAFGTTIGKAGSRDRFRTIDYDYPVRVAEMCRAAGAQHFILVSSKGASSSSSSFYLRVKGELEDALRSMSWPALTLLRPSIIGGRREESRFLERIGQVLLSVAPASVRTVPAVRIAAAMMQAATDPTATGVRILESAEILSIRDQLQ